MQRCDRIASRSLERPHTLARASLGGALCGALFAAGCAGTQQHDASALTDGEPTDATVAIGTYQAPQGPAPQDRSPQAVRSPQTLRATIGSEGGSLVGEPGSAFANLRLMIPPGALAGPTSIEVEPQTEFTPLPATAVRCGPLFALRPAGLGLALPATLTLPVDQAAVIDQYRFEDEVKVWVASGKGWSQRAQIDSSPGSVSVQIEALTQVAPGVNPPQQKDLVRFALVPNPTFVDCLAQFPGDARRRPDAQAIVVRGEQNDALFLRARNIKAGLAFSMFAVERSALDADGGLVPNFANFGLAVYHSDFDANARGLVRAAIRTILLDQAFVFDAGERLAPTSPFHLGFWFDDPEDAVPCKFNVENATPFNEEHQAGPMAMISLPDRDSGLGPLCTNPDTSVVPAICSLD